MGGEKSGVKKRIIDKQPKVLYTHCSGHSLNLVIAQACEELSIRNYISIIKAITLDQSITKEGRSSQANM